MKEILDLGVLVATVLLMVSVGIELERSAFQGLFRQPFRLALLFAGQTVLAPVVALMLVAAWDLPANLAAGLLLVAACPVGDLAGPYTALARGPTALAVLLNTISCLLAALTMPLLFRVYEGLLSTAFVFTAPGWAIVGKVFLMTTVPVLLGLLVRAIRPDWADGWRPWLRRSCALSIVALVVFVLYSQWPQVRRDGVTAALAAALFLVLTSAGGWVIGCVLGWPGRYRLCTAFLAAVRNLGLAAAVAITLMGRADYAVFGAVYLLVEVPLAFGLVAWSARSVNGARAT